MALLEVRDLHKSFDELEVLKGISFSMERGETLSVIGPSGGGKTTLLRCMNFLEMPDSGLITVGGDVLYSSDEDHRLTEDEIRRNRLHFGLVSRTSTSSRSTPRLKTCRSRRVSRRRGARITAPGRRR